MSDLRAAAARIRDVAANAMPGPWAPEDPMLSDVVCGDRGFVADCSVGEGYRRGSLDDARHIAAWSPDRALAVADLLDAIGSEKPQDVTSAVYARASALADLIGGTS